MKKNLFVLTAVFALCNSVFCITPCEVNIIKHNLFAEVKWRQVMQDKNNSYIIGFSGDSLYVSDVQFNKTSIIKHKKKGSRIVVAEKKIYLANHSYSNEDDVDGISITEHGLNGKLLSERHLPSHAFHIYSQFIKEYGKWFYIAFNTNEIKNDSVNFYIYTDKDVLPKFVYATKQSSIGGRISMPIVKVKNNIYIGCENSFNVDVYAKEGKKLNSIINNICKPEPYTKEEIEKLSPMAQSAVQEGITIQPTIEKIEVSDKGNVFVFRCKRSQNKSVLIDAFNKQGNFIKTIELGVGKEEKYIDSILTSENVFCCLLYSKQDKQYKIANYKFAIN